MRQEAHDKAVAKMLSQVTKQLRADEREKEKFRRETLVDQYRRELEAQPVYRVRATLSENKERVREEDLSRYDEATRKALHRKLWTKAGALALDDLAEEHGFTSGDEMVKALLAAPDLEAAVNQAADEQIEAERPGPDEIRRAALEAIHNDMAVELLALEEQILSRRANPEGKDRLARARARRQAVKAQAEETLSAMRWREAIRFDKFIVAERKALKAAVAALENGRRDAAAAHKYNQTLQAALVQASMALDREVEKGQALIKKITSRKATQTLGLDQDELLLLDAFLARYGVGDGPTPGADVPSLTDWAEEMQANGETVLIPKEILDGSVAGRFESLTVDQFQMVMETVKNIIKLGRLKHRTLLGDQKLKLDDVGARLKAQAAKVTRKGKDAYTPNRWSKGEERRHAWAEFAWDHMKIETILRLLDDSGAGYIRSWAGLFKKHRAYF
jgi:uncharacterized protein CbrC (UPF0167 family)